ncbi:hypothetical protein NE237_030968 [Protea cynaroides]|uniref:Uncharacterized protein n=1 Tax=Protea cynaroides TaxID=273540 RepID=A0A9Q0JWA1_9MAGN|nr:hypothetical protein NE237_030968 [Protea cynaroides]
MQLHLMQLAQPDPFDDAVMTQEACRNAWQLQQRNAQQLQQAKPNPSPSASASASTSASSSSSQLTSSLNINVKTNKFEISPTLFPDQNNVVVKDGKTVNNECITLENMLKKMVFTSSDRKKDEDNRWLS